MTRESIFSHSQHRLHSILTSFNTEYTQHWFHFIELVPSPALGRVKVTPELSMTLRDPVCSSAPAIRYKSPDANAAVSNSMISVSRWISAKTRNASSTALKRIAVLSTARCDDDHNHINGTMCFVNTRFIRMQNWTGVEQFHPSRHTVKHRPEKLILRFLNNVN